MAHYGGPPQYPPAPYGGGAPNYPPQNNGQPPYQPQQYAQPPYQQPPYAQPGYQGNGGYQNGPPQHAHHHNQDRPPKRQKSNPVITRYAPPPGYKPPPPGQPSAPVAGFQQPNYGPPNGPPQPPPQNWQQPPYQHNQGWQQPAPYQQPLTHQPAPQNPPYQQPPQQGWQQPQPGYSQPPPNYPQPPNAYPPQQGPPPPNSHPAPNPNFQPPNQPWQQPQQQPPYPPNNGYQPGPQAQAPVYRAPIVANQSSPDGAHGQPQFNQRHLSRPNSIRDPTRMSTTDIIVVEEKDRINWGKNDPLGLRYLDWDFDFDGPIWPKSNEEVPEQLSIGIILWHPAVQQTRALPSGYEEAEAAAKEAPAKTYGNAESVSIYFTPDNSHEAFLDIRQTDAWPEFQDNLIFYEFETQPDTVHIQDVIANRARVDEDLDDPKFQISQKKILALIETRVENGDVQMHDALDQLITARPTPSSEVPQPQPVTTAPGPMPPAFPKDNRQEDILASLGVIGAPKPVFPTPGPARPQQTAASPDRGISTNNSNDFLPPPPVPPQPIPQHHQPPPTRGSFSQQEPIRKSFNNQETERNHFSHQEPDRNSFSHQEPDRNHFHRQDSGRYNSNHREWNRSSFGLRGGTERVFERPMSPPPPQIERTPSPQDPWKVAAERDGNQVSPAGSNASHRTMAGSDFGGPEPQLEVPPPPPKLTRSESSRKRSYEEADGEAHEPLRQFDDVTPRLKRRQPRVEAAYSRR